jgi:hypothetical protein
MRRRLREQLRVREALLLDLGALVYELHRQGKRAPELLQRKAAELTVVDEEVRELQAALDGREQPAGETTEVEAVAGAEEDALDEERPEDGGLEGEPGDDGEPDEDGERAEEAGLREDELGEEDESGGESDLRQEDDSGGENELRQEDVLGEEDELGDTGELDALAEEDEQLERGAPGYGGREDEDSYDEPLVEREEPRG